MDSQNKQQLLIMFVWNENKHKIKFETTYDIGEIWR
jgi:hypothetical protein